MNEPRVHPATQPKAGLVQPPRPCGSRTGGCRGRKGGGSMHRIGT